MIARLADLPEFRELQAYIAEREEKDVETLARKTYALPESHDALEWEKLKARYAGARETLDVPRIARQKLSNGKESQ